MSPHTEITDIGRYTHTYTHIFISVRYSVLRREHVFRMRRGQIFEKIEDAEIIVV